MVKVVTDVVQDLLWRVCGSGDTTAGRASLGGGRTWCGEARVTKEIGSVGPSGMSGVDLNELVRRHN